MDAARNSIFQQIKPPCVALNQAVLAFQGRQAPPALVIARLEELHNALTRMGPDKLDSKLAEYAFIPLSYILKASQLLPIRASELTFECLAILLMEGWREKVAGPLGAQLLILLSITGDTTNKQATLRPSEPLLEAVFRCLDFLLRGFAKTTDGRKQLLQDSVATNLGHTLTVILNGLDAHYANSLQLAAMSALQATLSAINDHEMLASFLPGIVSTLTKVLTPSTKARRSWKAAQQGLITLTSLLLKTISTEATRALSINTAQSQTRRPQTPQKLNSSWLEATAGQLKLALANINRLVKHDKDQVRTALFDLNLTILRDCTTPLANCTKMCLEVVLLLQNTDKSTSSQHLSDELVLLLQCHDSLAQDLEITFRDWSLALPRILDGADEHKKTQRLELMFTAYEILCNSGRDRRSVSQLLVSALPDYVSTILGSNKTGTSMIQQTVVPALDLPLVLAKSNRQDFQDALSVNRHQADILRMLRSRAQAVCRGQNPESAATAFVSLTRSAMGPEQAAAFWLSLAVVRGNSGDETDNFLEFPEDGAVHWQHKVREDLYELALSVTMDDDQDWRMQALALETIALQAQAAGRDFRMDLIDALYPVLHLLGSQAPRVRDHAMVCLNIIAHNCEYADVKDLIVSNADYLVNAIALRLNAFDVAPQGPQVLTMMVKLAGPSLVPYLEDTVESVFAILEDYHGYTPLVEVLFSALKAITEQAVLDPRLQIEGPPSSDNYPSHEWTPTTIADLATHLASRKLASSTRDDSPLAQPPDVDNHPPADPAPQDATTLSAPKGKTYPLLQRIAALTAHYLPSSSTPLRLLLLDLLTRSLPTLARHEDTFLPLINTLWPPLLARLLDPEPQVVTAALGAIATTCALARSFMRSRALAAWPALRALHARIARAVLAGADAPAAPAPRSKGGTAVVPVARMVAQARYVDPGTRALWDAYVALLVAVVARVGVSEEVFDEALRLLAPLEGLGASERALLEAENADAVWLAGWRAEPGRLVVPEGLRRSGFRWAGVAAAAA